VSHPIVVNYEQQTMFKLNWWRQSNQIRYMVDMCVGDVLTSNDTQYNVKSCIFKCSISDRQSNP